MSLESSSQIQGFDWQKLFLSFEGRTGRSHFWIGWLILLGAGVVANFLPFVGGLLSIALIWPNLAISVKRLHDMGKSGWLIVVPWVLSLIVCAVGIAVMGLSVFANLSALENEDPAAILAVVGPVLGLFGLLFLVNIGFLLWIGLSASQPGDNRYGPAPAR